MEYLRPAALLVLTPHCFDEYFLNLNFLDVPCFKATLSKCIGLGIILGSLLLKVPQILKIHKSKSGEGISISSVTLELIAITIYMSYSFVKGFPFTAWGEMIFLAVQTLIVGMQVFYYGGCSGKALAYGLSYSVVCYIMMSGLIPIGFLWTLQGVYIPISLMSKFTQAYANYKNGHTGQLSAATLFMQFFRSLGRIFTSIQETGDFIVILTYLVSSFANTVVLLQLLYYWNVNVTKKKVE